MNEYTPDNWVIIKLPGIYKVLSGWSGGYLFGDSWRLNSGITEVHEEGDCFLFKGYSGSVVNCRKGSYGLRMNNAYVFDKIKSMVPSAEVMDENTDWHSVKWLS